MYQGRHDEVDPMVVILHGMGGSGKTQLVLKYCRQSMDTQRHNSIFWVDASTPKTTARSFVAIEGLIFNCKVDLSNVEASVKRAVVEMSKWQTAWLIVLTISMSLVSSMIKERISETIFLEGREDQSFLRLGTKEQGVSVT